MLLKPTVLQSYHVFCRYSTSSQGIMPENQRRVEFGRNVNVHFSIHRATCCDLFPGEHETVKIIFVFLCDSSCRRFYILHQLCRDSPKYLLDIS